MKKLCFVLAVLIMAFCVSACFPANDTPSVPQENSADVSENQQSVAPSESSDVSDSSVPDEESDTPDLSKMSPSELMAYADTLLEDVDSAKITLTTDGIAKFDGQEISYTSSYTSKTTGALTENPKRSVSFSDSSSGKSGSIYYLDGKGYFSSTGGRYSFDCNIDEFEEFCEYHKGNTTHFASPITGEYEPDTDENYWMIFYDMCTVTQTEDGGYNIFLKDVITDTELAANIFKMAPDEYKQEDGIDVTFSVYIDKDGYLYSQVLNTSITAISYGKEVRISAIASYEISDINKPIPIVLPNEGFSDVGDIEAMYVQDCIVRLNMLDSYSVLAKHEYSVSIPGLSEKVSATREFITNKKDDIKFSYDFTASLRGTKANVRQYYEDGIIYLKRNNQIQQQDVGVDNVNDSSLLTVWVSIHPEMSLAKDFVFSDNGDGTATLNFTYTDDTVVKIADYMFVYIYGETGYFTNYKSVTVKKATASITTDLKTGILISHEFSVEAEIVTQNGVAVYSETTKITTDVSGKAVPDRTVFFGQSIF
ncbi:MAG: hypothetical protein J6S77_00950 [Clostridia bacterium]|nr:hypothetical protein [Clostridia bacterium]